MKIKMKITFRVQVIIFAILLITGFCLSCFWGRDLFYNLAWALVGLAFVLHPVCPSSTLFQNLEVAEKGIRIAGAVLIFIGLTDGFAV